MSGYQLSGNAPDAYVRYAAHVMAPWTEDLISQAQCVRGDRVLELACGTGFVSSQASPDCKITGIDVNEAMLALARQNTAVTDGESLSVCYPLIRSPYIVTE